MSQRLAPLLFARHWWRCVRVVPLGAPTALRTSPPLSRHRLRLTSNANNTPPFHPSFSTTPNNRYLGFVWSVLLVITSIRGIYLCFGPVTALVFVGYLLVCVFRVARARCMRCLKRAT